jgi:hypothetical protein
VQKTGNAEWQARNGHDWRRAGARDHPRLKDYGGKGPVEFFVHEMRGEDGWVCDENGIVLSSDFGEQAILRLDHVAAPVCGVTRGFNRMPEIGRRQERAHFVGRDELAKFEPMGSGEVGVLFGGDDSDAMSAGAQCNAEADERQDVAVGSE